MASPPRPHAAGPLGEVAAIVTAVEAIADPKSRRLARLQLKDDELARRLRAKRARRRERVVDGVAKFIGGSLLTSSVALILAGHIEAPIVGTALAALSLFGLGTIFAASFEFDAAVWDVEADRIAAARGELEKGEGNG